MTADLDPANRQFSLAKLIGLVTLIALLFGSVKFVGWESLIYPGWGLGVVGAVGITSKFTRRAHSFEQFFLALSAAVGGGTLAAFCSALIAGAMHSAAADADSISLSSGDLAGIFAMQGAIAGGLVVVLAGIAATVSAAITPAHRRTYISKERSGELTFGWRVTVHSAVIIGLGWVLIVAVSIIWE